MNDASINTIIDELKKYNFSCIKDIIPFIIIECVDIVIYDLIFPESCDTLKYYNACDTYDTYDTMDNVIQKEIFDIDSKIILKTNKNDKINMLVFSYLDRGLNDWSFFEYFLKKYPNVEHILFEQNYYCTKSSKHFADSLLNFLIAYPNIKTIIMLDSQTDKNILSENSNKMATEWRYNSIKTRFILFNYHYDDSDRTNALGEFDDSNRINISEYWNQNSSNSISYISIKSF